MRRKNMVVLLAMGLVMVCGCSRQVRLSENISVGQLNQVETSASVAVAEIKTEAFEGRQFGDEPLEFSCKEKDGQLVYIDKNGGNYYYDDDILTMYISAGNAELNAQTSIEEVKNSAEVILSKVSPVYKNADTVLEISEDNMGGYEVCSKQKETKLAVLSYDSAGKLITANFNYEAYKTGDEEADKYSKEEVIDAAIASVKEQLGDKFEEFMSDDVVTKYVRTSIRGKDYANVDIIHETEEGPVGYIVTVSLEDLSIYLLDQYK